jgi:hypothetical protein
MYLFIKLISDSNGNQFFFFTTFFTSSTFASVPSLIAAGVLATISVDGDAAGAGAEGVAVVAAALVVVDVVESLIGCAISPFS